MSLPALPNRKACPDKPFAVRSEDDLTQHALNAEPEKNDHRPNALPQVVFILHVILVYVLWGSIAMDSDSSKCQDQAPSDLALDKTVQRLLAVHLTCVTDLLPSLAPTTDPCVIGREDQNSKTTEECKSTDTCGQWVARRGYHS